MQVTSLLSREEKDKHGHDHKHDHDHDHDHDHAHAEDCASCGHDHEHTPVRLTQTVVGVIFILNSYIVGGFFQNGDMIANFSAMLGAIILGYPIVWTSFKDIRRGILSINELVGIAVLVLAALAEEPWLLERYGDAYVKYKRRLRRFF